MSKVAVVYTDGSCSNNPGDGGSGVHGYIYTPIESVEDDKKVKTVTIHDFVISDKGYVNPSRIENGKCKPITVDEYLDIVVSVNSTTNNRTELLAIIIALEVLVEKEVSKVIIHADSSYAISLLNKAVSKKHDQIHANLDLYKRLCDIANIYKESKIHIHVYHVKGHSGHLGNDLADLLAGIGTNMALEGIEKQNVVYTNPKKYWTEKGETNPMITHSRILFNSKEEYNKLGTYYIVDPGPNELLLGKRIPETGMCIVDLKEPDELIEVIKSKQYKISRGYSNIIMLPVTNINNSNTYRYLDTYKEHAIRKNRRLSSLDYTSNESLTTTINPTGLSLAAIDAFGRLEELLDTYKGTGKDIVYYTDITNQLYELETKKKETVKVLKKEHGVGTNQLDIEVDLNDSKYKIDLVLGVDIPTRNKLKKLESYDPVVKVMLWSVTQDSFRYCTIIECSLGVGIWSNYYADRIFYINKKKK